MTSSQREECHAIIHTASASCTAAGAAGAQLPCSDWLVITPIQIGMIVALGKVFDKEIDESLAKSVLATAGGAVVGRGIASVLVGWIPGLGNVINASTAAAITESIGWYAAKRFDEES